MHLKSLHPGLLLAAVCAGAIPAQAQQSILTDTLAEQSYVDLEKEAEAGAVALWALGSIEEHGPHLPLSTDVEIPSAQLRGVKRLLAAEGVRAVIVPPYYWGVNRV
ncbi:MAG TPA: creatininase family protein, partial [Sphingomonas sp.]|nr:creatininase family protein [Sphingomonas sp.]